MKVNMHALKVWQERVSSQCLPFRMEPVLTIKEITSGGQEMQAAILASIV